MNTGRAGPGRAGPRWMFYCLVEWNRTGTGDLMRSRTASQPCPDGEHIVQATVIMFSGWAALTSDQTARRDALVTSTDLRVGGQLLAVCGWQDAGGWQNVFLEQSTVNAGFGFWPVTRHSAKGSGWAGGVVVKASDLWSRGRQFDSRLVHCPVA